MAVIGHAIEIKHVGQGQSMITIGGVKEKIPVRKFGFIPNHVEEKGGMPYQTAGGEVTLSGVGFEIEIVPTVREAIVDLRRAWSGLIHAVIKKVRK